MENEIIIPKITAKIVKESEKQFSGAVSTGGPEIFITPTHSDPAKVKADIVKTIHKVVDRIIRET